MISLFTGVCGLDLGLRRRLACKQQTESTAAVQSDGLWPLRLVRPVAYVRILAMLLRKKMSRHVDVWPLDFFRWSSMISVHP